MPISSSPLDAANGNDGKPAYPLQTFDDGAGGPRAGGVVLVDQNTLPISVATETSLAALLAQTPAKSLDMPGQDTPAIAVRQAPQKYLDISFSQVGSGLIAPKMTTIRAGAGMTVSQSGGNLIVLSGVTANAEFVARSQREVSGALTFKQASTLSQRIVNNNFYVEIVDIIGDGLAYTIINATTVDVAKVAHGFTAENVGQRMDICALSSVGVPMEAVIASIPNADTIRFTVAGWPASGSGICSLTGWNKVELLYTGTTATGISFNTRRKGWQNTAATAGILTTATGHLTSLNVDNGVVSLADKPLTAGGVYSNRSVWDTNIAQPDVDMYIQIRAKNGTVAPASTTTWTLGMLRVEDYIPIQVDITGTRQQSLQSSLLASVSGAVTATLAAAVARVGFVAGSGVWYDDTAAVLAAGVTFTGTSRDLTVTATATAFANAATYAKEYITSAESDVAGTLWIEVSRDNASWRRVKSVATAAVTGGGHYAEIVHKPSWRYIRSGFTNGATLQVRFTLNSIAMAV